MAVLPARFHLAVIFTLITSARLEDPVIITENPDGSQEIQVIVRAPNVRLVNVSRPDTMIEIFMNVYLLQDYVYVCVPLRASFLTDGEIYIGERIRQPATLVLNE